MRLINLGYQVVPWHIHGFHALVIGKDARRRNLGEEVFTQTIGSGETWDLLVHAEDRRPPYERYIFKGQDGFPPLMSQVKPEWWSSVPMEGFACPPDPVFFNYGANPDKFFPQFFPMHSHDDYKVTNNGVYPGGQLTYMQVDVPPKGADHGHDDDDDDDG